MSVTDDYLEHIRKAKESVRIPIIGSLNGVSTGGWIDMAKQIEQAGADALELNIYYMATDPDLSGQVVEQKYIDILTEVKNSMKIPVAVKSWRIFQFHCLYGKEILPGRGGWIGNV